MSVSSLLTPLGDLGGSSLSWQPVGSSSSLSSSHCSTESTSGPDGTDTRDPCILLNHYMKDRHKESCMGRTVQLIRIGSKIQGGRERERKESRQKS